MTTADVKIDDLMKFVEHGTKVKSAAVAGWRLEGHDLGVHTVQNLTTKQPVRLREIMFRFSNDAVAVPLEALFDAHADATEETMMNDAAVFLARAADMCLEGPPETLAAAA